MKEKRLYIHEVSAFISIQHQYEAVLKLVLKTILLLNRLLNIESGLRIYRVLIWCSDCNQAWHQAFQVFQQPRT